MTETTSPTSAELRQQGQAETQRATDLARRRSEIDEEIRSKQEEIQQERLRLARSGSPIETPTLTGELDALMDEREDLPEQHFAAREQAASLWIRSESVRMEELAPEIQAAQVEHDQAQAALEAAKEEASEKNAALGSLTQSRYIAKERRKNHEAELEKIAATGVQGMPDL